MKKQVIIDLPDDFEKGCCDECPFYVEGSNWDTWDDSFEHYCCFNYIPKECGLEIINIIGVDKLNKVCYNKYVMMNCILIFYRLTKLIKYAII